MQLNKKNNKIKKSMYTYIMYVREINDNNSKSSNIVEIVEAFRYQELKINYRILHRDNKTLLSHCERNTLIITVIKFIYFIWILSVFVHKKK